MLHSRFCDILTNPTTPQTQKTNPQHKNHHPKKQHPATQTNTKIFKIQLKERYPNKNSSASYMLNFKYKISDRYLYYILSVKKNKLFLKVLLVCNFLFFLDFIDILKKWQIGKILNVENFIEILIGIH